jgi:ribose transport system ATP-binding protein
MPTLLRTENLCKSFSGVVVLKDINISFEQGKCHVLVGENGAGKSTLIKMLCGAYIPTSGSMYFEEKPYKPQTSRESIEKGIRVVYQEFNLLPQMSVAENIFFDDLPRKRGGFVDFQKLYSQTQKILEKLGLDISAKTIVSQLGIAHMQLVEIAKSLSRKATMLILDEPTATLTPKEIKRLFEIINQLKDEGVTIIYISHRLNELKEIGDNISILRNGNVIKNCPIAEIDNNEIVRCMVGREIENEYPFFDDVKPTDVIMKVEHISTPIVKDVSFNLRRGEILGIAGLVGSGRTELLRAIFAADPMASGKITINNKVLHIKNPKQAVNAGISFITEDRKDQGLILDFEITKNITLATLNKYQKYGFLNNTEETSMSEFYRNELSIKSRSSEQFVRYLSGGNQQKVILGKWLATEADIILLDEPTRGIDVGARYEIYLLLWELARQGKAIIVVSSDVNEVIGISHRILVMSDGSISGEVERAQFDPQNILSLAYKNYL